MTENDITTVICANENKQEIHLKQCLLVAKTLSPTALMRKFVFIHGISGTVKNYNVQTFSPA